MADKEVFNQLLEELKALREEKNISLESIAEKSRIRLKYLQALESGHPEELPRVYDRFIFKTYLSALHVENPQKYLTAFDAWRQPEKKQTTIFSGKSKREAPQADKEFIPKPLLLKMIYGGIPVLVTIVLIVILFQTQNKSPLHQKPVKELTAQQIVKEAARAQEKQKLPANSAQAVTRQDSLLKIVIQAKGSSWMRYVKDHRDTSDFILKRGNTHTVYADSLVEFRIGNPSALLLKINSVTYDSLARPGQVISYMKVTPKGIVKLRAVFPKKRKVVQHDSTRAR